MRLLKFCVWLTIKKKYKHSSSIFTVFVFGYFPTEMYAFFLSRYLSDFYLFHSLWKQPFSKQSLKRIASCFEIEQARFYHTDIYFTISMSLIRIWWPCNLYNIIWTHFQNRKSFLGFESYICWERTADAYCRTLLTKGIILSRKISDKLITY